MTLVGDLDRKYNILAMNLAQRVNIGSSPYNLRLIDIHEQVELVNISVRVN